MLKKLILLFTLAFLISLISPSLLKTWIQWQVRDHLYPLQEVPPAGVALVLGAGLRRDGSPTAVLADRVEAAVQLYEAGKVQKILMSGDNRTIDHNEPEAMRQLALRLGVPEEDIVLDYAGRRTYDSCYRAGEIFGVEHAIVVTQEFHLNRAVYLCRSLGIETLGVAADRRNYRSVQLRWWQVRETAALVNAWLDIHILRPIPVLGEKLPIEVSRL